MKFTTKLLAADRKTVVREIADIELDLGSNLDTFTKKYGADVAYALIVDAAVVRAQAWVRGRMKLDGDKKKSEKTIREEFSKDFELTVGRAAADPAKVLEKAEGLIEKLSPEQVAALLKKYAATAPAAKTKKAA